MLINGLTEQKVRLFERIHTIGCTNQKISPRRVPPNFQNHITLQEAASRDQHRSKHSSIRLRNHAHSHTFLRRPFGMSNCQQSEPGRRGIWRLEHGQNQLPRKALLCLLNLILKLHLREPDHASWIWAQCTADRCTRQIQIATSTSLPDLLQTCFNNVISPYVGSLAVRTAWTPISFVTSSSLDLPIVLSRLLPVAIKKYRASCWMKGLLWRRSMSIIESTAG